MMSMIKIHHRLGHGRAQAPLALHSIRVAKHFSFPHFPFPHFPFPFLLQNVRMRRFSSLYFLRPVPYQGLIYKPLTLLIFIGAVVREQGESLDQARRIRTDPNRGIYAVIKSSTTVLVTIEPRLVNNNTVITCAVQTNVLDYSTLYLAHGLFTVQGLLSPPSGLNAISVESGSVMRLTWNPPFTLDITNVDPDITGYRVCFIIGATTEVCRETKEPQHEFITVSLPLEIRVAGINVIGIGDSSTYYYQSCDIGRPSQIMLDNFILRFPPKPLLC